MNSAGNVGLRESSSEGKHSAWLAACAFKTGSSPNPLYNTKYKRVYLNIQNKCDIIIKKWKVYYE